MKFRVTSARSSAAFASLLLLVAGSGCGRSSVFGSSPDDCPPSWIQPNGSCKQPGDGGVKDGFVGDGGHHDGFVHDGGNPDGFQNDGGFGDLGPCPPICQMDNCPSGLGCCACTFCQSTPICTVSNDGGVTDGGINCGNPANCPLPACVTDPRCHVLGTEICNNGIDDNDNGLIDCADPACVNFPGCQTMHMCPTPPVCTDPTCANNPACQNLQCHPTVNFGTINPMNSSSTQNVNTTGTVAVTTTPCAPPGGGMVVGQFTLSGTASVELSYTQGAGEDHVFGIYQAGVNQGCAANPVDNACYDPDQALTGMHTYPNLPAGNYYVIIQSFEALGEGPLTVTLSTETGKEICNNGVDDNNNGLIDCADPECFNDPNCVNQECNPDINVGTLVANGTPAMVSFNTTSGHSSDMLTCESTPGGQDVVVKFTLAQAAGVEMDWDQTGDHVIGLFASPPAGEPCDASQKSCYDPSGRTSDSVAWTELAAGDYELIFKATAPGDEGHIDATIRAFAYTGVELCNNGIDDNNNGLIDCADPQCFGVNGCTGPFCMPDQNLGDIEVGDSASVFLDLVANGKNGYSTKCSQGGGKAEVLQFTVASPGPSGGIGIGFDCTYTGNEVIDLHQELTPRDQCSSNDIVCADLATLPFGCGYEVPNLQPGTFNVIVQAFEPGDEGQMNLTISVNDDRQLVNCSGGGAICADRRCATSPYCAKSACMPEQTIDPLPLTGKATFTLVQTAMEGVSGTVPCATAPGGQTAAIKVHLTAAADLSISYEQVGNHAVGLFPVTSMTAPCDAGTILACQPAVGFNTSGMASFTNVPAGDYYILVAGDQPDGTTQYSGSVDFSITGVPHT